MREPEGSTTPAALFTRPFLLLCATVCLGYANHWIIAPLLPLYVNDLGGSAFLAGLALLAFSAPSVVFRPYVGRLADQWHAAGVLAIGLALLALGSLIMLLPYLAMIFLGGFVRGIGWAGVNTGGYTVLAAAAPSQRRGEAAGYYTGATSGASIVFPALGLWLIESGAAFTTAFGVSVAAACIGIAMSRGLAGAGGGTRSSAAPAERDGGGLFDRGVLISTGLNLCSTLSMPSVMAFLPLYARALDIANIGMFYVIAGTTNIVIRPLLGKWSDGMGRGPAIAIGLAAQLIGLGLIVAATGLTLILIGGVFVALGSAMIGSTTTALAMDLADPRSRGRAMATYSISYQMGMGLGSILAGALADLFGMRGMYFGSMTITACGLVLLVSVWRLLPPAQR